MVGSDPALTAGGTDYSRFHLQLNTAAVPGWSEPAPINPTSGFDLNAPDDPVNGPFIGPTSGFPFGTLTINLSGIGLTPCCSQPRGEARRASTPPT